MSIFTAVADYFAALGNRWIVLAAIMLISYLLGSFNTSIVVSKAFLKKDIRDYGSHNAGFTNAVRSMGIKLALLVMAGDVAKCALACVIGWSAMLIWTLPLLLRKRTTRSTMRLSSKRTLWLRPSRL